MNKLIGLIEKGKPFFEKISRNIYLRAIRDGFIAGMPVILFSSIFILIAYVPNAWGFHWSKDIETFHVLGLTVDVDQEGVLGPASKVSSVTASCTRYWPTRVRLRPLRWAPHPRAAPRSRAMERM